MKFPFKLFSWLLILVFSSSCYAGAPDFLENAIGVIIATHSKVQGYYEDEPMKSVTLENVPFNCNGFLVQKDGRVYFLTVKHILTKYTKSTFLYSGKNFVVTKDDTVEEIDIVLPELLKNLQKIVLTGENKFEVPETWYGLQNGTADAMAIDITRELEGQNLDGKAIPYESLAGISDQTAMNSHDQIAIVGYPGGDLKIAIRTQNGRWTQKFGEIIELGQQKLRGFSFGIELSGGDCGSPLALIDKSNVYVIGLMRTGLTRPDAISLPSVATDSIVVRDAINRKEMS